MSQPTFTYWNPNLLSVAELDALRVLDTARDVAERLSAFDLLLASASQRAEGQALDQFVHKERMGRFGTDNVAAPRRSEVLARARHWLLEPPVAETLPDGRHIEGANHATALAVLSMLGDATDLQVIERILETSSDSSVQEAGVLAAGKCSVDATAVRSGLLQRLSEIASQSQTPKQTRVLAVGVLRKIPGGESERSLVQLAETCDPPVGPTAALALAQRDLPQHRDRIAELLKKWPADGGFPIDDLRALFPGRAE